MLELDFPSDLNPLPFVDSLCLRPNKMRQLTIEQRTLFSVNASMLESYDVDYVPLVILQPMHHPADQVIEHTLELRPRSQMKQHFDVQSRISFYQHNEFGFVHVHDDPDARAVQTVDPQTDTPRQIVFNPTLRNNLIDRVQLKSLRAHCSESAPGTPKFSGVVKGIATTFGLDDRRIHLQDLIQKHLILTDDEFMPQNLSVVSTLYRTFDDPTVHHPFGKDHPPVQRVIDPLVDPPVDLPVDPQTPVKLQPCYYGRLFYDPYMITRVTGDFFLVSHLDSIVTRIIASNEQLVTRFLSSLVQHYSRITALNVLLPHIRDTRELSTFCWQKDSKFNWHFSRLIDLFASFCNVERNDDLIGSIGDMMAGEDEYKCKAKAGWLLDFAIVYLI